MQEVASFARVLHEQDRHPLVPIRDRIAVEAGADGRPDVFAALKPVLRPTQPERSYQVNKPVTVTQHGWFSSWQATENRVVWHREPQRTVADLIKDYSAWHVWLTYHQQQFSAWLREIVRSAFESPDGTFGDDEVQKCVDAIFSSCGCLAARPLPRPRPLAVLASGESEERVHEVLSADITQLESAVAGALYRSLETLWRHLMVGSVRWLPKGFSSYTFFTAEGAKQFLRKRDCTCADCRSGKTRGYTVTDYLVRLKHQGHYHEIHNSRLLPWDDNTVPKPYRVQRLLQATPELLRPAVHVLAGDQFYRDGLTISWAEKVVSQYAPKPEVLYRHQDPAVVFGPFVLAGW